MTFESEWLLIVAIYIWLLLASYIVFLTTLVNTVIPKILCIFCHDSWETNWVFIVDLIATLKKRFCISYDRFLKNYYWK